MHVSLLIPNLIFAVIQLLLGVLANGIIVVVNSTSSIKQRKILPFDLLLCCLATSRTGLQIAGFHFYLISLSVIEISPSAGYFMILMSLHKLELWLATWLSVFYCTKIATVVHPLFLWLKLKISKLVPWLIFGTLLYASLSSVFHGKYVQILSQEAWFSFLFQNATTETKEISPLYIVVFVIELLLPLLIFLTSVLLLIFSLGRHTQQMISTATGPRHPSFRIYISALWSFLSFLVLYVSQYVMAALVITQIFKIRNVTIMFYMSVVGLYPSVHSIILILGNPKLKQNAKKFLLHSKCCPVRESFDHFKEPVTR